MKLRAYIRGTMLLGVAIFVISSHSIEGSNVEMTA